MGVHVREAHGQRIDAILHLRAQRRDFGQRLVAAETAARTEAHAQGEGGTQKGQPYKADHAQDQRVTHLQVAGLAATSGEKDQVHLVV